jgi:hypothetical protein
VKACFLKRKNKKAAFREAEWSGSGKTNAKRIIADNPENEKDPGREAEFREAEYDDYNHTSGLLLVGEIF